MVRRVVSTRRAFLFMFLHRHLPAPPIDVNLESAPLFFCRRCTSHNNKQEGGAAMQEKEFGFKCPQCGQEICAEESMSGLVVSCPYCEKGIVVPKKRKKPILAPRNFIQRINDEPEDRLVAMQKKTEDPHCREGMETSVKNHRRTEFENMVASEAQRRKMEKLFELVKNIVLICVVTVIGCCLWFVFKGSKGHNKTETSVIKPVATNVSLMARGIDHSLQKSESKVADVDQQEKRREEENKDESVKMLNAYLNREKQRLNKIVEECKIHMEQIDLDQKDLSEAIAEIEKENEQRAENSRKRGIKRFDKAERVSLILKNPVMNAMAEKYTGESLNATYAKYKSEMGTEVKRYQEAEAKLRKNRENYYKSVEGADEWLDKRNAKARKMNNAVIRSAEMEIKILERELKPLQKEFETLLKQSAQMKSHYHEKRISELREKIKSLEERLRPAKTQLEQALASQAHVDATEGETSVRRKYDRAMSVRTDADNEVHKDSAHEVAVFNLAIQYENATLDMIRGAMKTMYGMQSARAADARRKLDYISRSAANIDFLKADEIEKIRTKVVEELSKGLTAVDEGAK